MNKTPRCILAVMAALALAPVPARAETRAEVDEHLDSIYEYDVAWFNDCTSSGELSAECGDVAGSVVCDLHAVMAVGAESGLMNHVARDVAELQALIGRNAGYLEDLIDRGYMDDTGSLPDRQLRQYCQRINSAVIP